MKNEKFAFTLIELLVVVSIIVILITLTSVGVASAIRKAKIQKARTEAINLLAAVNRYRSDIGKYPDDITKDSLGKALSKDDVYGTGETDKVFGPYLEFKESNTKVVAGVSVLIDPWGEPYIYCAANNTGGLDALYNDGTLSAYQAVSNGFTIIYSKGPGSDAESDDIEKRKDDIGTWQ
ncbi:MAG: hypothetical protein ACD_79C00721G0002 [uncultured bacterium]|nr:MAG: hypothetical protein ACD_79C00721G0002 [uncultured bacterium]